MQTQKMTDIFYSVPSVSVAFGHLEHPAAASLRTVPPWDGDTVKAEG